MLKTTSFFLAAISVASINTYAANKCSNLFTDIKIQRPNQPVLLENALIDKQLREDYQSPNIDALKEYNSLTKRFSFMKKTQFHSSIRELLSDESLSTFHLFLKETLVELNSKLTDDATAEVALRKLSTILKNKLTTFMSPTNAKERAKLILKADLDKKTLMLALGKMTQKESLEALIGKNGIDSIDADSLVGRYIAECKKMGFDPQLSAETFAMGPRTQARGEKKLYVAFDNNTLPLAKKYFSGNPHLLAHNHSAHQGTLDMLFMGKSITYAQFRSESFFRANNSIIPLTVLSSIEGSNAHNYFSLGAIENKFAKYPWGFKDSKVEGKETKELEYCRIGGYNSCTHWIGEAPIGEKFVDKYSVPGFRNDDPYGGMEGTDSSKKLRTAPVGTYTYFLDRQGNKIDIGYKTRKDRLARIVWTQKYGREQFWSMVGDKNAKALEKGEWANPGWVLYSFLSKTSFNRVPVVLISRPDASAPITEAVLDEYKRNISTQ